MKFESDLIFEDYPVLFCPELDEGYQIFTSWSEFLSLFIAHMHKPTRPLYVHKAELCENNVFVDASTFIVVPWDELDNYI